MTETKLAPCDVLDEMVKTQTVRMPDGTTKPLVANQSPEHSHALHSIILKLQAKKVVEIGMAQGASTLSILSAVAQTDGKLVSIDPYYGWTSGRVAALYAIDRAGFGGIHRHIEAPSYSGLPTLLHEGVVADLVYIDGAHDFENVFIDAVYADKILKVGGVVGFNDAGWKDVWRVIRWLSHTKRYKELDVGLKTDYSGRNVLVSLVRRLLRWPRQDRYFLKLKEPPST